MKPTAKNFFFLLSICILVWSCKKDFPETTSNTASQTKITGAFTDLKVANTFDWKNEKTVMLKVTALPIDAVIKNTLKVKLPGNSKALFAVSIAMNESFTTAIKIPAAVDEVLVTYGSIRKTVPVQNGAINFNYITE